VECSLVVGTTALGIRKQEQRWMLCLPACRNVSHLANDVLASALRVGEYWAFSNEAGPTANWLMTVPMPERGRIVNLAGGGAVCLYVDGAVKAALRWFWPALLPGPMARRPYSETDGTI